MPWVSSYQPADPDRMACLAPVVDDGLSARVSSEQESERVSTSQSNAKIASSLIMGQLLHVGPGSKVSNSIEEIFGSVQKGNGTETVPVTPLL